MPLELCEINKKDRSYCISSYGQSWGRSLNMLVGVLARSGWSLGAHDGCFRDPQRSLGVSRGVT